MDTIDNSSGKPTRNRRSKLRIEMELDNMYELLVVGATDRQLMKVLGMSERLYYYYKNKLYNRADKVQKAKTEKVITHCQQVLADRLLRMLRLTDRKLNDGWKTMPGDDFVNLMSMAQEVAMNIFRLEAESLRVSMKNMERINIIEKNLNLPKYLEDSGCYIDKAGIWHYRNGAPLEQQQQQSTLQKTDEILDFEIIETEPSPSQSQPLQQEEKPELEELEELEEISPEEVEEQEHKS